VATGRVVHRGEWDDQDNVEKVAYIPDGKNVATVSLDATLRFWDVATTEPLNRERLVGEGRLSPESIAFSPDAASHLLAIAWGRTVDLWDVVHLRRARTIANDGQYRPNSLVFSPDGTTLAAGVATRGAEIRLWRVGDGTLLTHPERGIIRIFRLRDKREIQTIESPCPWIEALTFTPDGKQIVPSRPMASRSSPA